MSILVFDQNATIPDSVFREHQQRVCEHRPASVTTFDGETLEKICLQCGTIFPSEISVAGKLDRCNDLEQFKKVRYGPSTPEPLQKFLLPTIAHGVKCRDKFVDNDHLALLRIYTDIQRTCARFNIPNTYAVEVMRTMLKEKKGLYSPYRPVEILQSLIADEPRLKNRIPKLQRLTKHADQISKLRSELKQLRKEVAHLKAR